MLRVVIDVGVYSSLWLGATAAALCAAATLAIGATIEPAALALAGAGTLIVYNVDRLRDQLCVREGGLGNLDRGVANGCGGGAA